MAKGGRRSRAGRPRTPTQLKVLQGTFRSDRHADEPGGEAGIPPAFPQPPAFLTLSDRAQRIWTQLAEHCGPWTAPSDWVTVWGLVRLIERLMCNHEAQLATEEAGHALAFKHTVIEKMGAMGMGEELTMVEAKSNPLVDQEIKLFDKLRPYIAMLGFSPVDRARMPKLTTPGAKADPLGALINRAKH